MTSQKEPSAADDKRRLILDAAAELVSEGGYSALSIRALASRAGMSLGLLYYYFADKHAVFAALMRDQQATMVELLDSQPRDLGLRSLLLAMVEPTRRQWLQVGRLVGVWRAERPDVTVEAREQQLDSARTQFEALERALRECAAAEGRVMRAEPEIVPFVWASLMGIADLHAQGWVTPIDEDRLTDITVSAIEEHVLEPTKE
ncbi:TetR/AcrR family transcriptional regulator [Nocardioides sp. Soil796]|uniref:TetR/AcrR family transcriptional regulator n=1 Tax=Nocardioides sp. Soil796 TaxID=1736412 RepID=UPI00138F83FA|nr:TetR/AcrR family transcriptional regulator [Nocardioides sp. Soil796]